MSVETNHLTTMDLANRLNLKPQTIRLWRMIGQGPRYIRLGGLRGRVLYRLGDVEEWERSRLFNNTSEEAVAVKG